MKNHFKFVRVVLIGLALLSFGAVASAQEITGVLLGTVKDSNGAAVRGATVTIIDPQKNQAVRTLTTDDSGSFTASELHVGLYDVSVEAPGFKKHVESKVQLDVGQRRSIDVTLEAGNVSEVVVVEANPVAVELNTPT